MAYNPRLLALQSCHSSPRGDQVRKGLASRAHLAQVVEVVLVMDPAVIGGHAVGTVGDVASVHTETVVELALEELGGRDTG